MPRFTARDFGYCLQFIRGSSQRITLSTNKILAGQTNSSFSIWIKMSYIPATGSQLASIYCERAAAGNDIFKLEVDLNKRLRFTIRDDANTLNQLVSSTGKTVMDGQWHMVTLTKSGTALKLYVDGVQDHSTTITATDTLTNASINARIGGDVADANAYYNGLMDEAWLFTRALSASEVSDLFYTGTLSNLANCVGHYKFDEGSGTAAVDSSGTRADGTITGATYSSQGFMKPRIAAP